MYYFYKILKIDYLETKKEHCVVKNIIIGVRVIKYITIYF